MSKKIAIVNTGGSAPVVIRANSVSAAAAILNYRAKENMTETQKEASRQNGKKGGRPPKYVAIFGNKSDWFFGCSAPGRKVEAEKWLADCTAAFWQSKPAAHYKNHPPKGQIVTAREAFALGMRYPKGTKC